MSKAKRVQRLEGTTPVGARGRTAGTTARIAGEGSKGAIVRERGIETNRPENAGGGKVRGDRRDMSKTYTTNIKHPSRGSNPRPDVKTRKR